MLPRIRSKSSSSSKSAKRGWEKESEVLLDLNRQGKVIDTDKGVWQTGRFSWILATLFNEVSQSEQWLKAAKHGISFLEKHCFDSDGRMFFVVDKKGNPVRKRRYLFSESFAAIAFAAYFKAGRPGCF